MFGIEQRIAKTAKRAGLLSGGLLFCGVGLGFLTVGGWFALMPIVGVQTTAFIAASVYLGVGCLCLGFASRRKDVEDTPVQKDHAKQSEAPPIIQAFMYGLQAGTQADQARRR